MTSFLSGTAPARRAAVAVLACLVGGSTLVADTLVLRNGREVRGELIRVDRDRIEFEERGAGARSTATGRSHRAAQRARDDDATPTRSAPAASARFPSGPTGVDAHGHPPGQTVSFLLRARSSARSRRPAGKPPPTRPPIPGRAGAALIGRVGEGGADLFFIGDDRGPIRMPDSGRLYLGINDDILRDNSGAFRVRVRY
jgi:hypothetical protein